MDKITQINSDLKSAMLAGDKVKTDTLKSIKAALTLASTEKGADEQINEARVIKVLKQESKKRSEAASSYAKAGQHEREKQELDEKEIIDNYLPESLSQEEVETLVDRVISQQSLDLDPKNMGKIISYTMREAGPNVDGGLVAKVVKEKINQ